MIQINLLPVRAAKKREFGRQQLVLFGLLLVIACGANYAWYQKVNNDLDAMNGKIEKLKTDIAQLEKTIGEVKSITQEKKALEDKLKILDSLKTNRTGPVKLMDELAILIPNKVWISEYSDVGGVVRIRGQALSYDDLSTFSKKLKASKHFKSPSIGRTSADPGSGVVSWDITCNADYSS